MRLILLVLCAFKLFAASSDQMSSGVLNYGKETVDSIQSNGYVQLEGTTVNGMLQLNGNLLANNAQLGEMQVNGQAVLNNCIVKSTCTVMGTLTATLSKFYSEIVLTTNSSSFTSCSLSSIRVVKVNNYTGVQTLELNGTTKISGTITFESGRGEVLADPECNISMSNITGGVLKRKTAGSGH